MMLVIGLIIIVPIIFIVIRLNEIKIKKLERIMLNLCMILISLLYIFLCFFVNKEPFQFKIYEPADYLTYTAVIYTFTPFLWIITIYYVRNLFKKLRIQKNSIIKKDDNFIYYRDTLNKVSPSIIMFTSAFDIDYKKCISATILKLKLLGFLEKETDSFVYTEKADIGLLESEKMILNLIKTGEFNKERYKQTVEKESLANKYIKKNSKGIWSKIASIILIVIFTIAAFKFSFWFDKYTFKNYRYYIEDDNKAYFILKNDKDIEKLYEQVTDQNDFYGSIGKDLFNGGERIYYSYDKIRADKFQYGVVRKAMFFSISVSFTIIFCITWTIIAIFLIIEKLIFINKNYIRTSKGTELLNKAYALKNYLKAYSLISERKENEIVLWEYYLIYATLLNVNVEIQDEVIKKYIG